MALFAENQCRQVTGTVTRVLVSEAMFLALSTTTNRSDTNQAS